MERVATDPDGGEFGHDYWEAVVETGPEPAILDYTIRGQRRGGHDGTQPTTGRLDGGTGQISVARPDRALADHGLRSRLRDAGLGAGLGRLPGLPRPFRQRRPLRTTRRPTPRPGRPARTRYRHGDVHGEPIITKAWDELPEGHCRAYQPVPCDEQALNRDFFGGDLAGLTAALDGLADLGVTVLYLNPIFAAPSNHRYDTSDYRYVDPDLGTQADFDRLIAEAGERGIRVVLDGVFNHVSADSPWFDRFGRYDELGACESADSPYRDWFTFRPPGPGQPEPCAPTDAGRRRHLLRRVGELRLDPRAARAARRARWCSWAPEGVVPLWIERGTAGWRLDVADSMSHEFQASIRDAAKAAIPKTPSSSPSSGTTRRRGCSATRPTRR